MPPKNNIGQSIIMNLVALEIKVRIVLIPFFSSVSSSFSSRHLNSPPLSTLRLSNADVTSASGSRWLALPKMTAEAVAAAAGLFPYVRFRPLKVIIGGELIEMSVLLTMNWYDNNV